MNKPDKEIYRESDTERENKVNIYENDEAYMLNDDKENNDLSLEELEMDNEDLNAARGNYHQVKELSDDDTIRNKQNEEDEKNQQSQDNLFRLEYISVCQFCKENFNSEINIPYLFKCGHFFCRQCIENNFTEENGKIHCPTDGLIGNSLKDLKLLSNLIIDNNMIDTNRANGVCQIHPNQKLSHYIEDTNEIICVYCAFSKFKSNPRYQIKEISEKCSELSFELDKLLTDNQNYMEILQTTLQSIKENKDFEEKRVSIFFNSIIKFLEEKKSEQLDNIRSIFSSNAEKLNEKLDFFSNRMEEAQELKGNLLSAIEKNPNYLNDILIRFNELMKDLTDPKVINFDIVEFKFVKEDENKILKYLENICDLNSNDRTVRFINKSFKTMDIKTQLGLNNLIGYNNEFLETSEIIDSDSRGNKYTFAGESSLNKNREYLGKLENKYQFSSAGFNSSNFSRSKMASKNSDVFSGIKQYHLRGMNLNDNDIRTGLSSKNNSLNKIPDLGKIRNTNYSLK